MNAFKGLPIITIPKGFEKIVKKKDLKTIKKKDLTKNRGELIIQCKNKYRNFYVNEDYGNLVNIPMATSDWDQRYSTGDYFTIKAHNKMPAFVMGKSFSSSFNEMNLNPKLLDNLKDIGFKYPSNIQTLCIPHILNGCNTMVSAETGNGKTHAYLIPIVNQLLEGQSMACPELEINQPKSIIIVPSRELAAQTKKMALTLTRGMNLKVKCEIGGGMFSERLKNPYASVVDILIGSFGTISKLFTTGLYRPKLTQHIVLDEVDTLLDDSFSEKLFHFLKKFSIRVCPNGKPLQPDITSGVQLTLTGATLPESSLPKLYEIIDNKSLYQVKTHSLHMLPTHFSHTFVRVGKHTRDEHVIRYTKIALKNNKKVIIFTNSNPSCYYVSMIFRDLDVQIGTLSSEVERKYRVETYKRFQDGRLHVLVCTDLMSRGVNTVDANMVINYKMPLFISDYLHRVGRIGRIGSPKKCEAVSFAGTYDKNLIRQIELSVRRNRPLDNVNANIKKYYQNTSSDNIDDPL